MPAVTSLSGDVRIASPTGLYTLKIPNHRWLQLRSATNSVDSDIELRGPQASTWVVSYVTKNVKENLNSIVAYRRSAMSERWGRIGFHEERMLLPETGIPVSFARYVSRGAESTRAIIYWVGTVVTDRWIIEVLGRTNGLVSSQEGIESVVQSISLVNSEGE